MLEIILGLGLGLGYLTSLRFPGTLIGFPEILVSIATFLLVIKTRFNFLRSESILELNLKAYLIVATFVLMPIATLITTCYPFLLYRSTPIYIASFCIESILFLAILYSIRNNIFDAKRMALVFLISFVTTNIISFAFFGLNNNSLDDGIRYSGGANNPNQLTFYAATLSLLVVVYLKRYAPLILPVLFLTILFSKSDAYYLGLIITFATYFILRFSFLNNESYNIGLLKVAAIISLVFCTTMLFFLQDIIYIWDNADEGGVRISLYKNAINVALASPIIGFGAGSFSGITNSFQGSEAHNNFLDLAMQFGFIFPLVIYSLMICVFFKLLKRREFFIASFLVGYIESGMFHFSARHFIFWVELAILMQYLYCPTNPKPE